MCDLCSSDDTTREKAKREAHHMADQLDRAADFYRQLAYGEVKPHSDASKSFANLARALVRELAQEWV